MKKVTKAEVDHYGDLCKRLDPFKADIAGKEKLRKKIVAAYDDQPADESFTPEGDRWILKLGPRTMRRIWKPGAIKRLATFLGDAFYKIAQVPLGEFDDHVTIPDRSKYVIEEQTGHRHIDAIEKPAAKAA